MDTILADVKWVMALVYLDDNTIFAPTFDDCLVRLDTVYGLLLKAGLKIQPKKCTYAMRQVKFLGHIIDKEGIKAESESIAVSAIFQCHSRHHTLKVFWIWRVVTESLFRIMRITSRTQHQGRTKTLILENCGLTHITMTLRT